jgi:hypothetical protein
MIFWGPVFAFINQGILRIILTKLLPEEKEKVKKQMLELFLDTKEKSNA